MQLYVYIHSAKFDIFYKKKRICNQDQYTESVLYYNSNKSPYI